MGLVLGEKEGGREGEAKGGKGQEESEERVGRVLREGKKCGEGEFGAHYSPALQRRNVHISGSESFTFRVTSARIRKSFPALTRIGSLLEAKSSNSDVI